MRFKSLDRTASKSVLQHCRRNYSAHCGNAALACRRCAGLMMVVWLAAWPIMAACASGVAPSTVAAAGGEAMANNIMRSNGFSRTMGRALQQA
eukprot:CAMPEP_0202915650 /NCGR_PEP_ID=MMETSP1392-20130828/66253_1 /ASSEMBLY_ACC=CAM_ASM_000868 /TAXON_ID=225041 /ORGANISM="Chlamydomonas chlamydogama, Strain SAG 11-48b" /LENGTH=92 /DNA_ID=CAMNT_0049607769 /DNA_START=254 /DNA_END=528 /DNA_ORIENTATION=-